MLREDADLVAAIGQRYEQELAAKDETIAALQRRVGAAEQERDLCRQALTARSSAPPRDAPRPPREDILGAARPPRSWRDGRGANGAWHAGVAVYRVAPGSAERLLQRLRWRLLPRFRRRPGFLAYQLLAADDETVVAVGLWASRAEAERAGCCVAALMAGSACAMVASLATRVAALAPADEGGRAGAGAIPAADIVAPPAAPWRRHRTPTAD